MWKFYWIQLRFLKISYFLIYQYKILWFQFQFLIEPIKIVLWKILPVCGAAAARWDAFVIRKGFNYFAYYLFLSTVPHFVLLSLFRLWRNILTEKKRNLAKMKHICIKINHNASISIWINYRSTFLIPFQ